MEIKKIIKKNNIRVNSKEIEKGDIFVCTTGLYNKNNFIDDAIKKGCSMVITNTDIDNKIPYLKIENIDEYLINLLKIKYHNPLDNKLLIGITGTDGKTTVTTILRDMLNGASIGTNGLEFLDYKKDLDNTTPSIDHLYEYFSQINQANIQNIIMEVSSESYLTKRIPGLFFDVGVFLNISNEHLDKHKDFENYLKCKKELLYHSKIKIINRDSPYYKKIVNDLDNYQTFGKKRSDLQIIRYRLFYDHTLIVLKYQKKKYFINSPLLGEYNVYNLAASILVLLSLKYSMKEIIEKIKDIRQICGRMEKMTIIGKEVMIDYAHTLNATYKVLYFLKKNCHKNLITVVGCAGGRYKEKRPLIGKLVCKYSKIAILTSDDPRLEDPQEIIREMIKNTKKKNYLIILNREEAIKKALKLAEKDDLVLILGKGHDNYMAIGDEKILYSDIEVLKKIEKKDNIV